MAIKYPYLTSPGYVTSALTHFRKLFPAKVNAETLQKLGLAVNSESHLINLLRFLNLIDVEGNRTDTAKKVFSNHNDGDFQNAFSDVVAQAYSELFELHGDDAWNLDREKLITYFRKANGTSERVGTLQAATFQRLASLAGHISTQTTKSKSTTKTRSHRPKRHASKMVKKKTAPDMPPDKIGTPPAHLPSYNSSDSICLTVRIEINLPASADQETYNNIFRSIKENLLNG